MNRNRKNFPAGFFSHTQRMALVARCPVGWHLMNGRFVVNAIVNPMLFERVDHSRSVITANHILMVGMRAITMHIRQPNGGIPQAFIVSGGNSLPALYPAFKVGQLDAQDGRLKLGDAGVRALFFGKVGARVSIHTHPAQTLGQTVIVCDHRAGIAIRAEILGTEERRKAGACWRKRSRRSDYSGGSLPSWQAGSHSLCPDR